MLKCSLDCHSDTKTPCPASPNMLASWPGRSSTTCPWWLKQLQSIAKKWKCSNLGQLVQIPTEDYYATRIRMTEKQVRTPAFLGFSGNPFPLVHVLTWHLGKGQCSIHIPRIRDSQVARNCQCLAGFWSCRFPARDPASEDASSFNEKSRLKAMIGCVMSKTYCTDCNPALLKMLDLCTVGAKSRLGPFGGCFFRYG